MKSDRTEKKQRKPGIKANYQGASPEQVARFFYWHRRQPGHSVPRRKPNRH